jgi:hypothetical protein
MNLDLQVSRLHSHASGRVFDSSYRSSLNGFDGGHFNPWRCKKKEAGVGKAPKEGEAEVALHKNKKLGSGLWTPGHPFGIP